jgi:protein TonB
MKLKDVRPYYSPALADAGVEGTVVMEGRIGTDGSMTGLKVLSSPHPDLSTAATDAVSRWQFEPTRLWGSPIETQIKITVDFKSQK